MTSPYTFIADLAQQTADIPADSIISRTIYSDDQMKVILFSFAPGQELSEHTAARPAVLHFISGTARLVLGEDEMTAVPHTWVHMPAHLPHSIYAETEVNMLLMLL